MNSAVADPAVPVAPRASTRPDLNRRLGPVFGVVFLVLLAAGVVFSGYSLISDMSDASSGATTLLPFLLLGIAGVLIHVSPA
jgi:inorganic phosphate transporter, PiT family